MKKRIGIIGTAGRDQYSHLLTARVFRHMVWEALAVADAERDAGFEVELVSGGAAWADHVAVVLHRIRPGDFSLSLKLPCEIEENVGFCGGKGKIAEAANFYHRRMSERVGYSTLHELWEQAMDFPVEVELLNDFKDRDRAIARNVDILIAFTFSKGLTPAPHSGTLYTWNMTPDRVKKIHFNLFEIEQKARQA